jgi:hypothetical protein
MSQEKTQINKIRNEKREIPPNKGNPGIIRDYTENLYLNKLENLVEMDKLVDTYISNLNQRHINHLNRSATHNEVTAAIKIL